MNVLIIEDDRTLAETLKQAMEPAYAVDISTRGRDGISRAETKRYDAVLLDLHLPDMSGDQICSILRAQSMNCPILVLTGRGSVGDKVALLDMGADDYIVKPFHLAEVKARLRRAIKRLMPDATLIAGDLELNRAARTVRCRGQTVPLRRKEFELLTCLLQHKGQVVTRDMAMNYICDDGRAMWANVIDVHIKRLRDKIDRPFGTSLIQTVHGVGYKIDASNVVAERRVGYERIA